MSNDPHHWTHFYQLGHATHFPPQLGSTTESTVVSTFPQSASVSPPATHADPSAGGSGGGSAILNPEGGVTKPARRRTRASRRTPTTVMNTDTTNFRAMVQQFTGGPTSTTFVSGSGPNMLSFGFGQAPALGLDHVQYSHRQQYQHQQYNNLLSHNTNATTNNNTYHGNQESEGASRVHFSLEGIGSVPRGSGSVTAVEGGYHQRVPRRSSSSDDNRGTNNNNSHYIF